MSWNVAFQILAYFVSHKEEIRNLIRAIQDLVPDAPGSEKALVVKKHLADALALGDKVEEGWPIVKPVFDLLVAFVKGKFPPKEQPAQPLP